MIRQSIEKRKELLNEVTRERRDLYQQFVNLVIDIFSESKTGNKYDESKVIIELYGFYKKYILYASSDVINSFSDCFHSLYNNANNFNVNNTGLFISKLCKIMADMRKDLGLSNKQLGNNGEKLLKALITDYDSFFNTTNKVKI